MRKITVIILTLLALAAYASPVGFMADSTFMRHLQKRDTVLIGDRIDYGVNLESVEEGTQFGLPDLQKLLGDKIVVASPWRIDTLKTKKTKSGNSYNLEIVSSVTSFDEGLYELPSLPLVRISPSGETDTLLFASSPLDIKTMPVDTATYVPHDIRAQVKYPLTFREILPYILACVLFGLLIWLAVWLYNRHKTRSGKMAIPDEPAHIIALRKLDSYRGNKYWAAEMQKQFYSGVTDALREYISSRYAIGAQEMTTAEIFKELKTKDINVELYESAKELFEKSDFVKFAKLTMGDDDNAKVLPCAIRFVTETYQEILDEEVANNAAEIKKK